MVAKLANKKPVLLPGQLVEGIEGRVYSLRGQRVMLSHDLAALYQVETKVLMQAVQRNIERFPEDFAFKLTSQEFTFLRSQIVTSSWGGSRVPPHAFTEQGVAMLCRADEPQALSAGWGVAFGGMRYAFPPYKKIAAQFKVVFEAIRELMAPPPQPKKKRIGFIQE